MPILLQMKKCCTQRCIVMSNKEIQEFNEKLRRGLEIAEKRMLQEKALRGQDVVVCGSDQIIRRIPAKQVIAENPIFQDQQHLHSIIKGNYWTCTKSKPSAIHHEQRRVIHEKSALASHNAVVYGQLLY